MASSASDTGKPEGMSDETYKQQLDRIATERRNAEREDKQELNPIVEKITETIPAVAPLLGVKKEDEKEEAPREAPPPGPPERPHHDAQVEEFVRDQHRSDGDGILASGKQ